MKIALITGINGQDGSYLSEFLLDKGYEAHVNYVFTILGLHWSEYIKQDEKFLRPEELHDLKGDSTKLIKKTGWSHDYTFETMLDEMIDYWMNYYKIN
jgi:GDPmannose 4,6-dehydratase